MFRRNFIARLTLAGVGCGAAGDSDNRTVTYRVKGFSCVTCAVGLDTMLRQQAGVVHSQSSYSDGITTIEFKPAIVNEKSLKAFISDMGFTASEAQRGGK